MQAEKQFKYEQFRFYSFYPAADDHDGGGGGGGGIEHVHEHSASSLPIHAQLQRHCLIGSSPMGMPSIITISIHENVKLKGKKNTSADDGKNATDYFFFAGVVRLLSDLFTFLSASASLCRHRASSTLRSAGSFNPANGPNFHFVMNYLHIPLGHGPPIPVRFAQRH